MTLKPKTQKAVRTGLWLLLDAVLINLAMILSQVLRYTTTISYSFFQIYFRIAPAMTLMGLILFAVFGLYRTMWQYASAEDLLRVVLSRWRWRFVPICIPSSPIILCGPRIFSGCTG